jgi:DNA topoisomerase-1
LNYDEDGNVIASDIETGIPCPICNNKVVKKKSKFGEFWGCSTYPTCTWIGSIDSSGNIETKSSSTEKTDIKCSVCKSGTMIKRVSKFGPWLGCSDYPKCKNTMKIDEKGNAVKNEKKKALKLTGDKCPKCKKGDMVERDGKYGKFKSCSDFPKCKYIDKEK